MSELKVFTKEMVTGGDTYEIAYGQVVISQQNFGIKITSVLESEELVNSLK